MHTPLQKACMHLCIHYCNLAKNDKPHIISSKKYKNVSPFTINFQHFCSPNTDKFEHKIYTVLCSVFYTLNVCIVIAKPIRYHRGYNEIGTMSTVWKVPGFNVRYNTKHSFLVYV